VHGLTEAVSPPVVVFLQELVGGIFDEIFAALLCLFFFSPFVFFFPRSNVLSTHVARHLAAFPPWNFFCLSSGEWLQGLAPFGSSTSLLLEWSFSPQLGSRNFFRSCTVLFPMAFVFPFYW